MIRICRLLWVRGIPALYVTDYGHKKRRGLVSKNEPAAPLQIVSPWGLVR